MATSKKMRNMNIMAVAIIVVLSLVLIYYLTAGPKEVDQDDDGTPGPIDFKTISLAGTGYQYTEKFDLVKGAMLFSFNITAGDHTAFVTLYDEHGMAYDIVTSTTGNCSGKRLFDVPEYLLQDTQFYLGVRTEGAWSIVIEQVHDQPGDPIPLQIRGTGDEVVGPIELPPGLVIFKLTAVGPDAYISAALYNESGMIRTLSASYGANEKTRLVGVGGLGDMSLDPGSYYLEVIGSGAWSISVDRPVSTGSKPLPVNLTGNNDAAIGPYHLSVGTYLIEMNSTNNPGSYAAMMVWNEAGDLKNNIYPVEVGGIGRSFYVGVTDAYWIDVQAYGDWSLTIRQL